MQGQVSVDAGVDHVLKESTVNKAVAEQEVDGIEQARIIRSPEMEGITGSQRPNRTGIKPAVGGSRNGVPAKALRDLGEAVIDRA